MKAQVCNSIVFLILLGMLLAACGSEPPPPITVVVTPVPVITVVVTSGPPEAASTPVPATPTAAAAAEGVEIVAATFAQGLNEEMQAVDPTSAFGPDDPVYLSVTLKGRPKEGVVTARFYYADILIAEAGVDLADTNSGLLFSFGEDTYVGYTLSHDQPFPVGEEYYAKVFYKDTLLATYPFQIVAPESTLVSHINDALLALGADDSYNPIQPTTTFSFDEEVYLVGTGDLVAGSSLQAEWYVDGVVDSAGTRMVTVEQDLEGAGFVFSFLPDGGWPAGEHAVVLMLDGAEIGDFPFVVVETGEIAPLVESEFWGAFPVPDDAEPQEAVEGVDLAFATAMAETELFGYYRAWLHGQGWEMVASQGASGLIQDWTKDGATLHLELQGIDEQGRAIVWVRFEAP